MRLFSFSILSVLIIFAGSLFYPGSLETRSLPDAHDAVIPMDHFVRAQVTGGGSDSETRTLLQQEMVICGGGSTCYFGLDINITAGSNPSSYDVVLWKNNVVVFSETYSTSTTRYIFEGTFTGVVGDTFTLQAGEAPDGPFGSSPSITAQLSW